MNLQKAKLVLEDGSVFEGKSFGHQGDTAGELVFSTAMTGYPESLTDPSFRGQILVATYPLIGNYGVPMGTLTPDGIYEHWESDRVQVSGLIVSEYSESYSHWNAQMSLSQWLTSNKIPALTGIDTRALTIRIRDKGAMLAKIVITKEPEWYDPNTDNLVAMVSPTARQVMGNGQYRIVLVDCGSKHSIIKYLLRRNTTIVRVPYDYDFTNEQFDGLFITNGPGDPALNVKTIAHLAKALEGTTPIMGICLGSQLLGLAVGAKTFKLPFGHRSHNQPVLQKGTERCYISSQNHGFAIDSKTLPPDWEVYFENANDGTCEGIRHVSKPFFGVQFHPEASGGPTDTEYLFDDFMNLVRKGKG